MMYICEQAFLDQCRIVIDWIYGDREEQPIIPQRTDLFQCGLGGVYYTNEVDNNNIMCRKECLPVLPNILQRFNINSFRLFLIHSDLSTTEHYYGLIQDPRIIHCYSTQCCIQHSKVTCIPIGITHYQDSDFDIYDDIFTKSASKNCLVYANFDVGTNPIERNSCLKYTGLTNKFAHDKSIKAQRVYLQELKRSWFVVSPNGNGVDCRRHWEALYAGAIPIVTKSNLIDTFTDRFPFVVLDNWSQYNPSLFTIELYYQLWNRFPNLQNELNFEYFLNRYCNA